VVRARQIMTSIFKRSARNEAKQIKNGKIPSDDFIDEWVTNHIEAILPKIASTTKEEVRKFVLTELANGVDSKEELAKSVREHFSGFPTWKANRIARTETRDVFNAGTLSAAEESGINRVQALDAQFGKTDTDCEARDGEIYTIAAARRIDEHPNGTLAWRPVPVELAIQYETREDAAYLDEERFILHLADDLPSDHERSILKEAVTQAYALGT
jgi:SPP1 gp7 family putative phage head morphogenesis protein